MLNNYQTMLLPEVLRCKTSRIRVLKPQVVLLDFHGTISERRWEDKVIFPYVKKALCGYLRANLSNETIQHCISGLKNESFEQRFRYNYEDVPIVEDVTTERDEADLAGFANQLGEFLLWQITNRRETKETQIISRLVWQDGLRRQQILTPIFSDVITNIKRWKQQYNCQIYVTSSIDEATMRLLFVNTDKGDLSQYLTGYLESKKPGDKLMTETYLQFYEKAASKISRSKSTRSPNGSTQSRENLTRPVLFLTDSGQEAKAASQVQDGDIFECLLVNRVGNHKPRTYYLSQFQSIDKFDDIVFV